MNFSGGVGFFLSCTLVEIPEGWGGGGGPSAPYKNYYK